MSLREEKEQELDFSKPLPLSDVVLVVEEQRFHVHRAMLAMWSPVFQQMFTSDFKEKTAKEVPLPEKKSSQIMEMLSVIYPNSAKSITEDNCYFLLALAQEYQMAKLTQMCEDFILKSVKREHGCSVLNQLIVSESYDLERLREECIGKTYNLTYEELKEHELYERVGPLSQLRITEGQLQKLEKEASRLRSQVTEMVVQAVQSLEHVKSIAFVLAKHIRDAKELKTSGIVFTEKQNMDAIKNDQDLQKNYGLFGATAPSSKVIKTGKCQYLEAVYFPLKQIQSTLESIRYHYLRPTSL